MIECHKSVLCAHFVRLVSSWVYVKKVFNWDIHVWPLSSWFVCSMCNIVDLVIAGECIVDGQYHLAASYTWSMRILGCFFSLSLFYSLMNFECFTPIISHLYGYLNCHRWEYIIEKSIPIPTLHTITINLFVQSVWIFCPAIGCLCWSYTINRNYSMCNHSFFVLPSLLLLLLPLTLP